MSTGNGQSGGKITLDGQSFEFTHGETIYDVARRAEREVPTLCYDDRLEAFGACRLCVVELDGARNPVASCTTQATDGMVVRTRTDALEKHRKTLMELVVSENPRSAETMGSSSVCAVVSTASAVSRM